MGDQAIKFVDELNLDKTMSTHNLEALFQAHHERVYLAAYRVSGSIFDAEDALQSVFLRLLNRQEQQFSSSNPGGYLCRAAINSSLDILRARHRDKTVNVDDSKTHVDPNAAPVDSDINRSEQRRQLRSALMSLNPRAAEIFSLRYFEDFNNTEIAEMLDTSSSSIAVTLHRTRERLQELLREFQGESQ